ncbi:AP2/B3-like transcriptional factor family protein [Striga asiatica]|uniref:AP2/B3-like transcriptional factor family protein n=1 Tax=Striga asiatica TaxID=4170 RepID=A0A5A7Q411_STRAF|nr:AP2/B3-like transcriptional factor family protein [Striga asiatica]
MHLFYTYLTLWQGSYARGHDRNIFLSDLDTRGRDGRPLVLENGDGGDGWFARVFHAPPDPIEAVAVSAEDFETALRKKGKAGTGCKELGLDRTNIESYSNGNRLGWKGLLKYTNGISWIVFPSSLVEAIPTLFLKRFTSVEESFDLPRHYFNLPFRPGPQPSLGT